MKWSAVHLNLESAKGFSTNWPFPFSSNNSKPLSIWQNPASSFCCLTWGYLYVALSCVAGPHVPDFVPAVLCALFCPVNVSRTTQYVCCKWRSWDQRSHFMHLYWVLVIFFFSFNFFNICLQYITIIFLVGCWYIPIILELHLDKHHDSDNTENCIPRTCILSQLSGSYTHQSWRTHSHDGI